MHGASAGGVLLVKKQRGPRGHFTNQWQLTNRTIQVACGREVCMTAETAAAQTAEISKTGVLAGW